jgi:hypothetical protein
LPDIQEKSSRIVAALNPLIDRIPYSDGGFRRRLLAGLIVGRTAWVSSGHSLIELVNTDTVNEIYSHFFPSFAIGLAVYLLGTLIELIGSVSLVRAAAGLVHAAKARLNAAEFRSRPAVTARVVVFGICANWFLQLYAPQGILDSIPDLPYDPVESVFVLVLGTGLIGLPFEAAYRLLEAGSRKLASLHRPILVFGAALAVPVRMMDESMRGFFGRSEYSLRLHERISPEARRVLDHMPTRIKEGLDNPIGFHGELALHHIVRLYGTAGNRKWAKQLISRVRDIAAIVSALVVATTLIVGVGLFKRMYERGDDAALLATSQQFRQFRLLQQDGYTIAENLASMVRNFDQRPELRFAEINFRRSADPALSNIFPGDTQEELVATLNQGVDALEGALPVDVPDDSPLGQSLKGLQRQIAQYRNASKQFQSLIAAAGAAATQRVLATTLALLAWQVVLFLYVILFVTLRSTVESLIEALTIEQLDQSRIVAVASSEELAV